VHEQISFAVPALAGQVAVTMEVGQQRQASVAAGTESLAVFKDARDGR